MSKKTVQHYSLSYNFVNPNECLISLSLRFYLPFSFAASANRWSAQARFYTHVHVHVINSRACA